MIHHLHLLRSIAAVRTLYPFHPILSNLVNCYIHHDSQVLQELTVVAFVRRGEHWFVLQHCRKENVSVQHKKQPWSINSVYLYSAITGATQFKSNPMHVVVNSRDNCQSKYLLNQILRKISCF